jgi:hypothetical protein
LFLLSTQAAILVDILTDMEMVLASDRRFLLGNWIRDALQFATSEEEIHFYNFNAKLQISIWGNNYTLGLYDYASKFWSGMIRKYVQTLLALLEKIETHIYYHFFTVIMLLDGMSSSMLYSKVLSKYNIFLFTCFLLSNHN